LAEEFLHHDPSVLADNIYFHHGFPAHSNTLADFVKHVTETAFMLIFTHSSF